MTDVPLDTWWQTLVTNCYDEIFRFCTHFLGDVSDGADATQETFLRAWKAKDQLKDSSVGRSWLFQISRNVCIDHTRWWKRAVVNLQSLTLPKEETPLANERIDLKRAINSLPTRQREVILLRHFHGFSTEDTAKLLGIDQGSVKSHLFRAQLKVRKSLEDCKS